MERTGMHVGYWWEIQKERDHWEDLGPRGRIMLGEVLGIANRLIFFCDTDRREMKNLGGYTDTRRARRSHKLPFIFQNKESRLEMDVRDRGWGDTDWIHLAQDRDQWMALVNSVMNLRVS
jgi:hypothetical protein